MKKRPAPEPASPPAAGAPVPAAGTATRRPGAFYQDDGPGDKTPANLDDVADAIPRMETLRAASNRPYTVLGRDYVPRTALAPFRQRGVASWYGKKFHGSKTSSGEIYDMYAMTAAHPTLPIPSYARVTNISNQRSVIVRINDRGPFLSDRIMDLSYTAAYKLGFVQQGSAIVELQSIDPASYKAPIMIAGARGEPGVGDPAAVKRSPESVVAVPADGGKPAALAPVVEARPVETLPGQVPAPPAQAANHSPITSDQSGIYLQLGAFAQRDNAESFRTRIHQQLGWLTDTIHIRVADGLYRVHLGPYRDRAEAEGVAERIRQALALKPMLIIK